MTDAHEPPDGRVQRRNVPARLTPLEAVKKGA